MNDTTKQKRLTKPMREMLSLIENEADYHVTGFKARGEIFLLRLAVARGLVAPTSEDSDWYRITPNGLAALGPDGG